MNSYKLAKKKAHERIARERVLARRIRIRAQRKLKRFFQKMREAGQIQAVPVRLGKAPRPMRKRNERQLLAGTMNFRNMLYYGIITVNPDGSYFPNNKYAVIRQNILDRQNAEKETVSA